MNQRNLRRSPTQVAEALATAEELFKRGQTLNEIANTLGITTMTLYRWRRKHNSLAEFANRTGFEAENSSRKDSDMMAASLSPSENNSLDASISIDAQNKPSSDRRMSSDALLKELRWLRRLAAELLLKNQRLEAELRGELDH